MAHGSHHLNRSPSLVRLCVHPVRSFLRLAHPGAFAALMCRPLGFAIDDPQHVHPLAAEVRFGPVSATTTGDRRGPKSIDAACRDRKVADLITAAGASAPADAVFGGRFATGEAPRSTTSASEADEGDGAGGDGGTGFDLFGPDPTPMEDL